MALTFRSVKGSALTHSELDANLTTLNQERSATTFETGDKINFYSGGNVYVGSGDSSNSYGGSTISITLAGGYRYLYNPVATTYDIDASGLYSGESCFLLIHHGSSPMYTLSFSNTTVKWCNSPPQFQSSGTPTADGKTAPDGTSTYDYSQKVFSFYKDSSGTVWARYLGSNINTSSSYQSSGFVLVP